jgi:hypothetical protein
MRQEAKVLLKKDKRIPVDMLEMQGCQCGFLKNTRQPFFSFSSNPTTASTSSKAEHNNHLERPDGRVYNISYYVLAPISRSENYL